MTAAKTSRRATRRKRKFAQKRVVLFVSSVLLTGLSAWLIRGATHLKPAGEHPMRVLEQSAKRLARAGAPLKGIVFNDVPEKASRYSYGYGYGKYVYQYGYRKSD